MTFFMAARMRATSLNPSAWICLALSSVVVERAARCALPGLTIGEVRKANLGHCVG